MFPPSYLSFHQKYPQWKGAELKKKARQEWKQSKITAKLQDSLIDPAASMGEDMIIEEKPEKLLGKKEKEKHLKHRPVDKLKLKKGKM